MGAAGAAIGTQAAGGLFNIYRSTEQGQLLRQNATLAERDIPLIRAATNERARQLQVGSYLTKGAQRAGYGGRGLAVGGSVFDIMSDTATNFDRDTSFVLLEGEMAARAKQREADLFRYQAKIGVRDAIIGSVLNTGATASRAMLPNMGGSYSTYQPPDFSNSSGFRMQGVR